MKGRHLNVGVSYQESCSAESEQGEEFNDGTLVACSLNWHYLFYFIFYLMMMSVTQTT
jgi:hypothetical protein